MGSEARLLLRAPLGVVEVEQKRPLNHVGERLRASLAEEALQDGEDALRWGGAGGEREDDARRLGPGGEVLATWASIRLFGSLARRPRPPSEGSEETTVPTVTLGYYPMPPEPKQLAVSYTDNRRSECSSCCAAAVRATRSPDIFSQIQYLYFSCRGRAP